MPNAQPERLVLDRYSNPLAEILLVTDEDGFLRALDFADHEQRMLRLLRLHYGDRTLEAGRAPDSIKRALDDYFRGELRALRRIAWKTNGTAFQRSVWIALTEIPEGGAWSYGRLAAHIGKPKAMRAVGLANGSNPVGIVVPCHRVIGANGTLTGYGGGIERKRWLLEHEGAAFR